jgi:type II secretory pathway pseudopilin PulG
MKKNAGGFLLLEALMSLTLLGLGMVALMESFHISKQWIGRARISTAAAACLDEQAWLSLSHITIPSTACPEDYGLRTQAEPFSLSLIRQRWTVTLPDQGGAPHDTSVEGFRSAL